MKRIYIDSNNEESNKKHLNEISIFKELQHQNIVKYYESFIHKNKLCIVMEYAEEGDLSKIINKHREEKKHIDESAIWNWFFQISEAIRYIHSKKILHRDIKSQNIFLSKGGQIKLGDFGISKVLSNTMDYAKTSLGTPYFLSPEICSGEKYNFKTDIWMLGCVLYELSCLRKPFEDTLPIPKIYSTNLQKLVTKLLLKDANSRPSIEETLLFDFVLEKKKVIAEPFISSTQSNKPKNDFRILVKRIESEKNYEVLPENKEAESLKNSVKETDKYNNRDEKHKHSNNNNNNKDNTNNNNKILVRNLNISLVNSGFNKISNLSEVHNYKISSKSARSSSASMIPSSGTKNETNPNSNKNLEKGELNDNNCLSSQQKNLNLDEMANDKFERFITNTNNNDKRGNSSLTYTDIDSIKKSESSLTAVNFQSKIFQKEKHNNKNIIPTPTHNKDDTNNNNNINLNLNNAEFKNVNKFLNVSNNNINKGILITDIRENTDNNNNCNSFVEESNSYVLKTHSDVKMKSKKIDYDVVNNCMKSFLEIERNLNLKKLDDKLTSKTPLKSKMSNSNEDFYELKEKKINEKSLNYKLSNEGSRTTKNLSYVKNKNNKSFAADASKKENNILNENAGKRPNIPISGKIINEKKCEIEDLKFNINYEFDLYSQQDDCLKQHQRRNDSVSSGISKSPERVSYSDNDYFDNAEKLIFEPKINTPNNNSIQEKTGTGTTLKTNGLSLQEKINKLRNKNRSMMNIDINNDDKSLNLNNIESQNTPSYQGSTVNTLSNRDKKNIKNVIKNHKIQITDSDLTSQELKANFNLSKQKFNKTEICDISPKSPVDDLIQLSPEEKADLILNNFEDTFSKNKINLKSCINLTSSNSKNFNEKINDSQSLNAYVLKNNNANFNPSNSKRQHLSRSIDNSCSDLPKYRKYTDNSNFKIIVNKSPDNSNNMNNSGSVTLTSDIECNLNKTTMSNNNYKNSEKSIEKEKSFLDTRVKHPNNNDNVNKISYKNKINLKLNNKHLLKKSNNKKISINISSIQSPDHRAVYKIEKIENYYEKGENKYEGFKDMNRTKTEIKNTQNNSINMEVYNPQGNKDLINVKNKKLFLDDIQGNIILNKPLNSSVSNNLNDRIQRAISNSPNRIVAENSNGRYNESLVNEEFTCQKINRNKLKRNEICISSNENLKVGSNSNNNNNKDKNHTYSKIIVNCSMNFYNKKPDQTDAKAKYPPKHKTIEHDEDTEDNLKMQNNLNLDKYKNTNLNLSNSNFNTPLNRKSRPRLNSSENLVGRMDQNKNYYMPVTDQKSNKYDFNYNPKLNFLRERYGDDKFKMLMDLLENSNDLNNILNDNERIKNIVGEDYKIAKSFLKNISNEIFSNRANSPSKTIN